MPALTQPLAQNSPSYGWPQRLADLADQVRSASNPEREPLRALWLLLNSTISRSLYLHYRRLGSVRPEDHEDLVAEKSLELLRRIDSGQWVPKASSPGEIVGYVSSCARNGLVDHIRQATRARNVHDLVSTEGIPVPGMAQGREMPHTRAERQDFVSALQDCLEALSAKKRRIWFFRVFYEMRSKAIASHPEINTSPGHVDVILHECRGRMRECMESRGLDPSEMPPGTFTSLWKVMRVQPPPDISSQQHEL